MNECENRYINIHIFLQNVLVIAKNVLLKPPVLDTEVNVETLTFGTAQREVVLVSEFWF